MVTGALAVPSSIAVSSENDEKALETRVKLTLEKIRRSPLNVLIWPKDAGKTTIANELNGFTREPYDGEYWAVVHVKKKHVVLDDLYVLSNGEAMVGGGDKTVEDYIKEGYKITILTRPTVNNNDWLVNSFGDFQVSWIGYRDHFNWRDLPEDQYNRMYRCGLEYEDADFGDGFHFPFDVKDEKSFGDKFMEDQIANGNNLA